MTDYIRQYQNPRFPHEQRETERLIAQFDTDASVSADGVVRWNSNGSVPPQDILDFWAHLQKPFDLARSAAVRSEELDKFLAEYRANARPPSDEELHEMRAAFGPGEVVVNVITGQRTKL